MPKNEASRKDRVINVLSKKSEDEWAHSAQAFFERITPLWFNWIGWIIATGGVATLADKTGSSSLKIIEIVSYFLVTFYFIFFFASIRIEPYHSWASNLASRTKRLFALSPLYCLALILVFSSRELIHHIIEQIKNAQ